MVSVPLRDIRRGGEGGVTLPICISSHLMLMMMTIIFIINITWRLASRLRHSFFVTNRQTLHHNMYIDGVDDGDDDDVWHDTASASHSGLGTRFPPTQLFSSLPLLFLLLYLQIIILSLLLLLFPPSQLFSSLLFLHFFQNSSKT